MISVERRCAMKKRPKKVPSGATTRPPQPSVFDQMSDAQRQKLSDSLKRLGQKMNMPPNRKVHELDTTKAGCTSVSGFLMSGKSTPLADLDTLPLLSLH